MTYKRTFKFNPIGRKWIQNKQIPENAEHILKQLLYPQNNTQDTPKPLESTSNSSYTSQEKV